MCYFRILRQMISGNRLGYRQNHTSFIFLHSDIFLFFKPIMIVAAPIFYGVYIINGIDTLTLISDFTTTLNNYMT